MVRENIRIMGIAHLIGNIVSGWLLGIVAVLVVYLVKEKEFSATDRICFRKIVNFNLSYWIYFAISFALMLVLIGFVMIAVVYVIWFVVLIIGFLNHLEGKSYTYPGSIEFLK